MWRWQYSMPARARVHDTVCTPYATQTCNHLLKEVASLALRQSPHARDVIKELATLDVLGDDVDVVAGFDDLVHAQNVRVLQY